MMQCNTTTGPSGLLLRVLAQRLAAVAEAEARTRPQRGNRREFRNVFSIASK